MSLVRPLVISRLLAIKFWRSPELSVDFRMCGSQRPRPLCCSRPSRRCRGRGHVGESHGLGCQGLTSLVRTLQGLSSDTTESQLRVSSHGGGETDTRALRMHPSAADRRAGASELSTQPLLGAVRSQQMGCVYIIISDVDPDIKTNCLKTHQR